MRIAAAAVAPDDPTESADVLTEGLANYDLHTGLVVGMSCHPVREEPGEGGGSTWAGRGNLDLSR